MEHIGLLTIHNTVNYGSLLQTYATYRALSELGCNVKLIDYRCEKIEKREAVPSLQEGKSIKEILRYLLWHKDLQRKHDCFWEFIQDEMKLTETYSIETIKDANRAFDTFVVGSDIVWGTNITGKDMTFFLDFVDENKRKLSFSSSIGTKWEQEEQIEIRKLLKRFEQISVREQLAAQWIQESAGIKAKVTCDPTMLWKNDFWLEMMDASNMPKENYVLIYLVNPDRKNIIDGITYAKKHGLVACFINFYKPVKGTRTVRPASLQEWIAFFANAKVVFTASYHGLLFSLYFHRDVFYYNRGETSRMISLGEEMRILHREGTDENIQKNIAIDYEYVDAMMDYKRKESWKYLKGLF